MNKNKTLLVAKNDPVCYAGGSVPTVKAKFRVSPKINSARLSADAVGAGSPLGGLGEQTVAFNDGVSDWTEFSMDSAIARMVRKTDHRWEWKVSRIDGRDVTPFTADVTGPHRVYTLFADPKPPWAPNGVGMKNLWTNALDFCNTFLEGKDDPQETMAAITSNLFYNMGFRYDTTNSASHYWGINGANTNGIFEFTRYMAHDENLVNCYDQAYGVATIAGLIGIKRQLVSAGPFGYINITNLVGVGQCNNPIYGKSEKIVYWKDVMDDHGDLVPTQITNNILRTQICYPDETQRSYFQTHVYVWVFDGRVFDACVGPALGTLLINDYMRSIIDHSTDNERRLSRYWDGSLNWDAALGFDYKLE
jgi:hypothetical protein